MIIKIFIFPQRYTLQRTISQCTLQENLAVIRVQEIHRVAIANFKNIQFQQNPILTWVNNLTIFTNNRRRLKPPNLPSPHYQVAHIFCKKQLHKGTFIKQIVKQNINKTCLSSNILLLRTRMPDLNSVAISHIQLDFSFKRWLDLNESKWHYQFN